MSSKLKNEKAVSQSMRWHITINNPIEHGLDRDNIKKILGQFNLSYWCMVDEVSKSGTPHTHIVIVAKKSKIRFSTVQRKFLKKAHIENLKYDIDTNINYLRKDLHDYSNYEEFGERPQDKASIKGKKQGANSKLLTAVKKGLSVDEILEILPSFTTQIRTIEHLVNRQTRKDVLIKSRETPLVCIVKTGATGTGKTRSTMEEAKGSIYKVTYYTKDRGAIFDKYDREKYLCFEEFMGSKSVPINSMLTYLDPWYPCTLGSRYDDPCSLYTHVVINTNLPFERLYDELTLSPDTMEQYRAWLRRITEIQVFKMDGTVEKYSTDEYMKKAIANDNFLSERIVSYINKINNKEKQL